MFLYLYVSFIAHSQQTDNGECHVYNKPYRQEAEKQKTRQLTISKKLLPDNKLV